MGPQCFILLLMSGKCLCCEVIKKMYGSSAYKNLMTQCGSYKAFWGRLNVTGQNKNDQSQPSRPITFAPFPACVARRGRE